MALLANSSDQVVRKARVRGKKKKKNHSWRSSWSAVELQARQASSTLSVQMLQTQFAARVKKSPNQSHADSFLGPLGVQSQQTVCYYLFLLSTELTLWLLWVNIFSCDLIQYKGLKVWSTTNALSQTGKIWQQGSSVRPHTGRRNNADLPWMTMHPHCCFIS